MNVVGMMGFKSISDLEISQQGNLDTLWAPSLDSLDHGFKTDKVR